jgi:broad specificity phosphatase PhoE
MQANPMENETILDRLHPSLIPALGTLPVDTPVALLTRHSIREQGVNGFATYDVPLTAEGVALAQAWGSKLTRPVSRMYSSPVGRCVATAEAIAMGAGIDIVIKTHAALVEPGSYVQDLSLVGGLFFKLGPIGFANKHLRNELRGVLSPEQGARQLLRHLQAGLGEPGTLSVHVTHDTILAAFIYYLRGEQQLDDSHWPWMLEGAFVWFEDEVAHWLWRGERGDIRLANGNG